MADNLKAALEKDSLTIREQLAKWFRQPSGRYLQSLEYRITARLLERMFGYHIVQIGAPSESSFYRASPITHKILIRMEQEPDIPECSLQCRADAVPILADTMDVVILPHQLEFTDTPHKLLREIERILIGEGYLIIIGFNPWSLCGLWRLSLSWRDQAPWNGRFYSHARIRDWLSLLDMEWVHTERVFYLPPIQQSGLIKKLGFLEKLGRYCWSYLGGVHIIVARKHVAPLTPLKLAWQRRRNAVVSGVTKPTTRSRE